MNKAEAKKDHYDSFYVEVMVVGIWKPIKGPEGVYEFKTWEDANDFMLRFYGNGAYGLVNEVDIRVQGYKKEVYSIPDMVPEKKSDKNFKKIIKSVSKSVVQPVIEPPYEPKPLVGTLA